MAVLTSTIQKAKVATSSEDVGSTISASFMAAKQQKDAIGEQNSFFHKTPFTEPSHVNLRSAA
jgi:hypothetical protein